MLGRSTKFLLVIEVIVFFVPMLVLLLLGGLLVPLQIDAIGDEPLIWQGPAYVIGSVVFGVIGLLTLLFVMTKLFLGHRRIAKPTLICTGVALGALPVIDIAVFGDSLGWRIVGALPLAVSAHILFLSRRLLFPSRRDGLRSIAIATTIALVPVAALTLNPLQTTDRTLQDQRAYWEKTAPDRYEYTIQLSGWLKPEVLHPKRITVENGEVISAVYVWNFASHNPGDPAPTEGLWTIDRAFVELLTAKSRGWSVSARFDERWGFVEKAFVDADESTEGWNLEVRDFQVAPFPADAE